MAMSLRSVARKVRTVKPAAVLRPVRRHTRDPFEPGSPRPLLLHCCHHKAGTVWLIRVLQAVADHHGLRFQNLRGAPPAAATDIALQHDSQIDVAALPRFRGSHMIRDPRDIVVSAYFFHLWTTEAWARAPSPEYGGLSYQDHLRSLPEDEGLLAEIRHSVYVIDEMRRWNYRDPRFLEVRYEDAIADETGFFSRLFRHYGFRRAAVETSVDIALRFSFERLASRRIGETREGEHLRSGRPGQWQDVFRESHGALFKELAADTLIVLGYERDDRW